MFKTILKLLLLLIFVGLAGVIYIWQNIESPYKANGKATVFNIDSGSSVKQISTKLEQEGLIKDAFYFDVYIWQKKYETRLQAGEYSLSAAMSIPEIVETLIGGKIINKELTFQIIEGWNIKEVSEYIAKSNLPDKENLIALINTPVEKWPDELKQKSFLAQIPAGGSIEGYLFPDTYRIFNDATAEDILNKIFMNFDNKLDSKLLDEIKRQGKTLYNIITMASIVEKEVPLEEDRPIVAGILYKRMRVGMRLEVDATINYVINKNTTQLSYKDLALDSPYNTYKNDGLPPGPISNPSLSAIKAAIYPQESPYLFYLHPQNTANKKTIFSKTYDEHLRNKAKYLN